MKAFIPHSILRRFMATFAAFMIICSGYVTLPVSAQAANKPLAAVNPPNSTTPPTTSPSAPIPQHGPDLKFSNPPTDLELEFVPVLQGTILPTKTPAQPGENQALGDALNRYAKLDDKANISPIVEFLAKFPESRWAAAVELHLGSNRFENGYFSEALRYWENAWLKAKQETQPTMKSMADQALAQFLLLNARLGRMDVLEKYFAEIRDRAFVGDAATRINGAKEGLTSMKAAPGESFKCGPYAVESILNLHKLQVVPNKTVRKMQSSVRGTNLAQLQELAKQLGLDYQMAFRNRGAEVIVPSVVHWKVDHFSAVLKDTSTGFQTRDRTFGTDGDTWISKSAMESESDGYFLVPSGPLPDGWRPVSKDEGAKVWGKGTAHTRAPAPKKPDCPKLEPALLPSGPDAPTCSGMPIASAFLMQATGNLVDVPLKYPSPVGVGIPMEFRVNYNYLEEGDGGTDPKDFPLGTNNWSINWRSYMYVKTSDAAVSLFVRGGGSELYKNKGPHTGAPDYPNRDLTSQAKLNVIIPWTSYQRVLPDGTIEIFDRQVGERVYLTKIRDPQSDPNNANDVTRITYDQYQRVTMVTDRLSRSSIFTYASTNPADTEAFYRIRTISDPFGRSCSFAYDSTYKFLVGITDSIGLTSTFEYQSSLLSPLTKLTTPYGTTTFEYYTPSWKPYDPAYPPVGLKVTLADSSEVRLENFIGANNADTYTWDRENSDNYPSTAFATRTQFQIGPLWLTNHANWEAPVVQIIAPPSQASMVNTEFHYAGETLYDLGPYYTAGATNLPGEIKRGSQSSQYLYNSLGFPTQAIDPLGRKLTLTYAANNIDLIELRQTRGANNDLLGKWTYPNPSRHLPLTHTDSSGQATQYQYNSFAQPTQVTDPNGSVWTLTYSAITTGGAAAFLSKIEGPLGSETSITYDNVGRVASVTNKEGYKVQYSYDSADRLLRRTYPDGTYEQIVYGRLDPVAVKDRSGRWTQFAYDSLDQLAFRIDSLGQKTQYQWCHCGKLSKLTDAKGNETRWEHDVLGRITRKIYADAKDELFTYDSLSRLRTHSDSLATRQVRTYSYNLDDSLQSIQYTNATQPTPNVTFTYDPDYLRLTAISSSASTLTYGYNPYIQNSAANIVNMWVGGAPNQNDTINLTFTNSALAGGSYAMPGVTVTTSEQNDPAKVAALIANRINSDATLSSAGITATPTTAATNTTRLTVTAAPASQLTVNATSTGSETITQGGGGQLWSVASTVPANAKTTYSYDLLGRTINRTINGTANVVASSYDALDRTTSASNALGLFSYSYVNATSRLASITYPNNVLTKNFSWYGNQLDERLQQIINNTSAGALSRFNLAYTPAGEINQWQEQQAANKRKIYQYDLASQLSAFQSTAVTKTAAIIGGAPGAGDTITITFNDSTLATPVPIAYNVQSGDTLESIATQLTSLINGSTALQAISVSAVQSDQSIIISSASARVTVVTPETSTNSTETIYMMPVSAAAPLEQEYFSYDKAANRIGLQATPAPGVGVSTNIRQWATNAVNQLTNLSAGGMARFEGTSNKALKSASVNSLPYQLPWSKSFAGNSALSTNTNSVSVSVTDGSNTTVGKTYNIDVAGPSSQMLEYDNNGNLKSDGAREYFWDAENRLVRIVYGNDPGQTTQFVYDPIGRRISLTESGTSTGTKEFVWTGTQLAEERAGGTTKKFFSLGQKDDSSNLFYTRDHLGSVREVIADSGLQAQYSYTPFGERTKIAGSGAEADFGFAGMYHHARSGLNLTMFRAYDARLGRWLSRDPLGESMGTNLYAYLENDPINFIDPLGLKALPFQPGVSAPLNRMPRTSTFANWKNPNDPKNQNAWNCHSWTFHYGAGDPDNRSPFYPRWDFDPHNDLANSYRQVSATTPSRLGDVVIYANNDGIQHSARVEQVDQYGNATLVSSKLGQTQLSTHHPLDPQILKDFGSTVLWYTKK